VYDHHHGTVFNGWEPASEEFLTYQEEIERLNEFKKGRDYEQEQIDTARTLGEGE
jgi:outer membrane translocation and assembly module TamA